MVKTYGEKAFIYGLHYDDTGEVHHIGRTKHLLRRMAEYRRNWYRDTRRYTVLEELAFGPLSMERETRWLLHALKHGWPIDNFDVFSERQRPALGLTGDESEPRAREIHKKEEMRTGVAHIEPLTASFETIFLNPILNQFMNTVDAHIVHWFIGQPLHEEEIFKSEEELQILQFLKEIYLYD